jgi:predicted acylesterase/phospholipase RssA/CRP-like cAMP-binding protein
LAHDPPGASPHHLVAFLERFGVYARLPADRRREVAAKARIVNIPAGEAAFRQGDEVRGQYLVRTGRLELWKDGAQVGTVSAGASLGEVSLLAGEPHTVSAVARRDSEVVLVGRDDFLSLTRDREVSAALLDDLGRMLAASGTFSRFRPKLKRSVLALVPIGLDVSMAAVRDAVVGRLREWGPTAVWSTADFGEDRPPREEDFPDLGRRLDELERTHEFVVLETDPSIKGTAWTRFCARQADRILGVAGADPAPPPTYEGSRTVLQGCELVFATAAPPEIRRGWIDRLSPRAHYNLPSPDAIGALSRRVTGRSIGLVLSGGGARGLAHIGVIRGLLDAGLEIDRVGGTSMGAFVGALYAMGHAPEEIVELCRRELVRGKPFHDFSVPLVSLARGRRAIAMMERLFGATHIEDLAIDFFCVTADLAAGEAVVHRRGDIIRTVGASMSIPGWAPPIVFGERVLVDGGVLNNFPVGVMAATGEGPVIGVDAMAGTSLLSAASKGANRLPTIMETLGGAATLGSRRLAEAAGDDAAVVIKPDVGGVGLVDFQHLDRLFEMGRQAVGDTDLSALSALSALGAPAAGPPAPPA